MDGGTTATYTYNAQGQRVEWVAPPSSRYEFAWDASGEWMGLYNGAGNSWSYSLVNFGARHLVLYGSDTRFFHANSLGSTTMQTDASGGVTEDVQFYPWGQEWVVWPSATGYNFASTPYRDANLGADFTLFRVYHNNLGRWLTPDPLAGDILNPQSLNRYAYALNNATNLTLR